MSRTNRETERLMTGEAWRRFCDRLKAVGDRILEPDFPADERSRAEGFRALARLIVASTEFELEAGDPAFPDFVHDQGPRATWGGANPDVVTLRAAIDPTRTYKVWADVDGLFQATFSQHEGSVALGQTGIHQERHLDSFELDEDGFLELIVSPDEHSGNWIPSHPDAQFFTVRIVVSDWESHTAPTFHIEQVGVEGEAPPAPSPAGIAAGLERAAEWIEASATHWHRYALEAAAMRPPNAPSPLSIEPGDPKDIATGRCLWNLREDEALLVTCEVPLALYWSFGIQTLTWFESGDFARRQTSLTGDQIHLDEDGFARLVLSAQDPGTPNWIDTEDRPAGLLVYRYGWAETLPVPEVSVVSVEAIRELLPADHPVVTREDRRDQLSLRREALWNRFG